MITRKRIYLFRVFFLDFLNELKKGDRIRKVKIWQKMNELMFLLSQNVDLELGGGNLSDFDSYMSVY